MERLQRALSEARRARRELQGNVAPVPNGQLAETPLQLEPRQADPRRKSAAIAMFPPLWSELTPYEPNPAHLQKHRIQTLNADDVSSPFDMLRTKFFLLMQKNNWKRVAITSPTKGCGKTTTACNLAVGLSRQRENRSILFDMDLRRPSITTLLGRAPQNGIKSMLTGEVAPEDQMLCLRGNVALALNKTAVPDATQLLLAQRTADTLDRIQEDFDPHIMIFDLPPMLATDDARAFLSNVDCAIIVARAEQTKHSQLDQCEREVAAQTNVLGVVLNECRHIEAEDRYYGKN